MNNDVWIDIPLYGKYQVTINGQVRRKSDLKVLRQFENKTSKGTYLTVAVKPDGSKRKTEGVHRLVCLAFHGVHSSYPKIDVNHKDGDKHNNHKDNLEWMTRSENVKHSFTTGMRNDSRSCVMTDHQTGETTPFVSMAEVAAYFGLKHKKGFHLAAKHQHTPYQGRYTFEFSQDYTPASRKNTRAVYCVDYPNHRLIRCENLGELELMTGLPRMSIQDHLRLRPGKLVNGCLIWRVDDSSGMLAHSQVTQAMVDASVEQYALIKARGRKEQTKGYRVKNYLTGEELTLRTLSQVAPLLKVSVAILRSEYKTMEGKLYNGHAVQRLECTEPFIAYPEIHIELSLRYRLKGKVVKVTDTILNTTEYWPSLSVFAKSIGQDPESLRHKITKGTEKRYQLESV
jgi:hypothetical protein